MNKNMKSLASMKSPTGDTRNLSFVMWGTKAFHKNGKISRPQRNYCFIDRQDKENYYGVWTFGLGLIDVRFPKTTTCPLSKKELKEFRSKGWAINGDYVGSFSKYNTFRK